jgi:hypothetical protein
MSSSNFVRLLIALLHGLRGGMIVRKRRKGKIPSTPQVRLQSMNDPQMIATQIKGSVVEQHPRHRHDEISPEAPQREEGNKEEYLMCLEM